ncbi:MAG: glutaredoxin domain-containing protein [Bilifractor sp.]|nr:glutaredoxin domain-containing protein [Bilifractor sp.]
MVLELYKKDTCPYCQRVMGWIRENGRTDVVYRDILEDPDNHARLIRDGGMDQVPCLFIDGKPLYESMDIIQFLADHPM